MTNETKYNFSDFTLAEYENLIDIAKRTYSFVGFDEFNANERHILWRHDIDMSPAMALKIAEIESLKKVKATYYILLHTDFYNLLDPQNRQYIESIAGLGHDIGLHFDTHFYNINSQSQLNDLIIFEKDFLERIFGIKITSFSFHNNTPFTLSCDNEKYGGLINTYSKSIKQIPYCSDSNGYWRYNRLKDVLTDANFYNLQVLTHEVWWQNELMSPRQKIQKCVNEHSNSIISNYENDVRKFKLLNIDWE